MNVDYFVLTALPDESEALFKHLPEPRDLTEGYWISDLETEQGGFRSVLIYRPGCGQGTNAANSRTSYTITKYHPCVVLLTGIAGGFDEHGVCLGDVLVHGFIEPYELAKVTPEKRERRHPTESVTAGPVIEVAKAIRSTEWYKGIKKSRPNNRERAFPEILWRDRGVVGSGDKNLANRNSPERRYLQKKHKERALGFEMEGAGVASACKPTATPYAVVKAVQDNGTIDKDDPSLKDEWREYAADAAATLATQLMQKCSFFDRKASDSEAGMEIGKIHRPSLPKRLAVIEEFYCDREGLRIEVVKRSKQGHEVWAAFHTGIFVDEPGFYSRKTGEAKLTKLVLVCPGSRFLLQYSRMVAREKEKVTTEYMRNVIVTITGKAKDTKASVRWFDGPVGVSFWLVDAEHEDGWGYVEVPIAAIKSLEWPGFIIKKSTDRQLYQKFVDSFDSLWKNSHRPHANTKVCDCPKDARCEARQLAKREQAFRSDS
ncbi:MAG: hypothetical protein HYX87_09225 [Chloroflexi bacterium]|nr:hypothetical protein [Chloroflexota bacterium]